MDGYSANPPIVVRPRRLRGLRLVAFIAGALIEVFGVFLLEREGVSVPFLIMLVGFWITVFALGGRSLANPYWSRRERFMVIALCGVGMGILYGVTSIQSLRHLAPTWFGFTIAWVIAVSHASSYLRYCRGIF
jgi:hypothetical protein